VDTRRGIKTSQNTQPVSRDLLRCGAIVCLCLVALALYLYCLDGSPLWWDEGISISTAQLSLSRLLRVTAVDDVHPPGYYLLLHGWMRLAGASAFSTRALSAFAGVLLVPLLYAAGRRLGGRRAGMAATIASITSGFVLNYAREVRMYGWGMMLAALSTYAFLRVLDDPDTGRRWWAIYVASIALGVNTQYVFAIVPAAQIVSAVMLDPRRWSRWLVAGLVTVALSLPWMLYAGSQVSGLGADRLGAWNWALIGRNTWHALHYIVLGQAPAGALRESATIMGLIVLVSIGCIALVRQKMAAAVSLILAAAGAIGVIAIMKYYPGEDLSRGIKLAFAGIPSLLLLVGVGTSRLWVARRWVGISALALLIASQATGVLAFYRAPVDTEEDYRPLIAQVQAMAKPGDAILATYAWQRGYFASYAPDETVEVYGSWPAKQKGSEFVAELLASHARLWVVSYLADVQDDSAPIYIWLRRNAVLVFDRWYGKTQLALFLPADELPERWLAQSVFEDGTSLDYVPLSTTAHPGDTIQFSLRWQPEQGVEPSCKVLVHLGTAGVEPVAQHDLTLGRGLVSEGKWPPGGYVLERYALWVPQDTPAGEYHLYVGLYNPQDRVRLKIASPSGCDDANRVCIGRVTVAAGQ